MRFMCRRFWTSSILTALWLCALGIGIATLWGYKSTPGEAGMTPTRWPDESGIESSLDRPSLVVFAHPRCPCTRATLGELERLVARCKGQANVQVWFIRSQDAEAFWSDADLWDFAAKIPGVAVKWDEGGQEASRFGAQTSGYAVFYDTEGRLLFRGGLTMARGHAGDSLGQRAIMGLLSRQPALVSQTPVFGCPLF